MNILNYLVPKNNFVTFILYAFYTLTSVCGLTLIKFYLPMVKHANESGYIVGTSLLGIGVGFILYISSFLTWIIILERVPLSSAYPVAIGLTLIFSIISSIIFLNEVISFMKATGIFMILLGVILIFRSPS